MPTLARVLSPHPPPRAQFPAAVAAVLPFAPLVGVISTLLLVGSSVSSSAEQILAAGPALQGACALLHILGGLAGYACAKPLYSEQAARTVGINLAMKSSAFGYLLATLHFEDFAVRVRVRKQTRVARGAG